MSISAQGTRTLRLIAALQRDDYYTQAGSAPRQPVEIADRRPTATTRATPYRLDWETLAQDHQEHLAAYVARHGGEIPASGTDRTTLHQQALAAATSSPDAAADLAAVDLADSLAVALAAGDGHRAVTAISCPGCHCWSLLAVRAGAGGWRAACRNLRCGNPQSPSTWTLRQIAAHHVRETAAA